MRKMTIPIIILLFLFGCGHREIWTTDYRPLRFDGNGFVVDHSLLKKDHFDKVEKVLTFYGDQFTRISETKIELAKPLTEEIIYNFTRKAEDPEWLKTHQPKEGHNNQPRSG